MTLIEEQKVLESWGTHFLVHDVLKLADGKDCVDAYYDVLTAAEILKGRMNRMLGTD